MGKSADSVRVIKSCRELAQDYAPKRSAKNAHIKARKVEHSYARKLKMVARAIGDIVTGLYNEDEPFKTDEVINHLNRYAKLLEPWAKSVGARMVAEVNARDKAAWAETSKRMAGLIRREVSETAIGQIFQARLAEQVHLITSLPIDAAERVHKLTIEGMSQARRAEDIASEIMRSGNVSRARSMLIARTEVSRTHVEFQRARAESIGSTQFYWRTSGDGDVRESHRVLNGKIFEWNNPPLCDPPGHHALPGGIWACRCWAEPILSDWE